MPGPANLVHESSTSTGTGNFTLFALNGRRRFSAAFGTGSTPTNVFDYFIESQTTIEWEQGTGHMSDANTLVRDTVIASSNGGALVNFTGGAKDVVNDLPAEATIPRVTTLAALKALTPLSGQIIYLQGRTATNDGGQGTFAWTASNLSTQVTNDPGQGVYIPPNSDATGASGAWVRPYATDGVWVKWFGAVGDGTTDDTTAVQRAINTSAFLSVPVNFSVATYKTTATINCVTPHQKIRAHGEVIIKHVAAAPGKAISIGTGLFGVDFGGPGRFLIIGNANTTVGVYAETTHHSYVRARVTNGGSTAAFQVNGAVCSKFDFIVSVNEDGAFANKPAVGLDLTGAHDCEFDLIIEGVVNGLVVHDGAGNTFRGTTEACDQSGVQELANAGRNRYIEFDSESNARTAAGGYDFSMAGTGSVLDSCAAYSYNGTESSLTLFATGGNSVIVIGNTTSILNCDIRNLNISASARETFVLNTDYWSSGALMGGFVDSGTRSRWFGVLQFTGSSFTAVEDKLSITATGATSYRTLQAHFADVRYAKDFGVLADGSTDDTAALQAAINATPNGGLLLLPDSGLSIVIGSGSACLTVNTPITIRGTGWGSGIRAHASVPNTRDIIAVTPPASERGWSFESFRITNNSSARHGINFNGATATLIYAVKIDKMLIDATLGGKSINTTSGGAGGILAYSEVTRCLLDAVSFDTAGDGLYVAWNNIGGTGASIYYNAVVGAAGLVIRDNILTGTGGQIVIDRAVCPLIEGNELEQGTNSTNSNGAMIDLNGTNVCADARLVNNAISVSAGITGVTGAVRVANCQEFYADGNRISVRGSGKHYVFTASSTDARVSDGDSYLVDDVRVTPVITDSGTRTILKYADPANPSLIFLQNAANANLTFRNTDGGTSGVNLIMDAASASPAVFDSIGTLTFRGRNSSAATKDYGSIFINIQDVNAGTEDSGCFINLLQNGSLYQWAIYSTGIVPNSGGTPDLATGAIPFGNLFLGSGKKIDFNNGDVTMTHAANTMTFAGAANGWLFAEAVSPTANDGAPLGSATVSWADLFLASGGVINWNNGDVTITHSTNTLTFGGASSGYLFDAAITPTTNDGAALGSGGVSWADLFLANGGVINFANSAATLSHIAGHLIGFSGSFALPAPPTKTGTSGSQAATDGALIINASGTFTLTLLAAASYPGRFLFIKSIAAQTVNSASSNVVPLAGGSAGTALLTNTAGKWAILQSDGSNWIIMAAN